MCCTAERTSDSSEGVAATLREALVRKPKPPARRISQRIARLVFIRFITILLFLYILLSGNNFGAQLSTITQEPCAGSQCTSNECGRQIVPPEADAGGHGEQSRK